MAHIPGWHGAIYGVGDAALNSLLPPVLYGFFFPEQADVAFAHLKFWQAAGGVLVFVLAPLLQLTWLVAGLFGAMLLSGTSVALLSWHMNRQVSVHCAETATLIQSFT